MLEMKGLKEFFCIPGIERVYLISGDDTFNDVFRDFSNMASREPDRLKRKFDPKDPDRQTAL